MLTTRASREFCLLAITALLVIGAGLGLRDPWPSDEPRFALVAKHMIDSGDWLFPHRGNELYSDKPPMLMWLQALCYLLLRDWRVAFLLPSLLAALGTLACVYDLGRRLWTRRVGLYAAWALLFTLHFTFQAKKAQIDPLVVFFITLGNYGLLRHLLLGPNWRYWMLGWFAAGLGVITKGVGVITLLLLLPAALAAAWRWPRLLSPWRDRRFWWGPLLFLIAILAWLLPVTLTALATGRPEYRAYLGDILFNQTANRYARSWDHAQPWWYHFVTMATMWMPMILALPWALPAWWRRLRRRDPRYLLLLGWWALVVLFFSIPGGKRDVYILPALPMACLALAPLLPGLLRRRGMQWLLLAFTALFSLLLLSAGVSALIGHPGFEQRLIDRRGLDSGQVDQLAWTVMAIGGWGVASLLLWRVQRSAIAVASLLTALWVGYGLIAYPLLNDSSSARGLMQRAVAALPTGGELGLVAWKEQNLLMAPVPVSTFGFRVRWEQQLQRGVAWQAQRPQRRRLLVQEAALLHCVDRSRARVIGIANRRRWWLVPAEAVTGSCQANADERVQQRLDQGKIEVDE